MGANFATVNHMIINALVLEAFQEVIPGTKGSLVYLISHDIARKEIVNAPSWVHRKGTTRAFPAKHHALEETPFYDTGHPILLPGNPVDGSSVMVGEAGTEKSCYSVNHRTGRHMSRTAATKSLDQEQIDRKFDEEDILTNCRNYPRDEAPRTYKDFEEVLKSVKQAGLASEVARLKAQLSGSRMGIRRMTDTRGRDGPRYRLLCRECGAALSRALAETTSEAKYRHKDGEQVIPVGFFARAENVIIKNARFYGAKDGEVLVGVADLPFALAGGSRNGCCGPTGMHGFDTQCARMSTLCRNRVWRLLDASLCAPSFDPC